MPVVLVEAALHTQRQRDAAEERIRHGGVNADCQNSGHGRDHNAVLALQTVEDQDNEIVRIAEAGKAAQENAARKLVDTEHTRAVENATEHPAAVAAAGKLGVGKAVPK